MLRALRHAIWPSLDVTSSVEAESILSRRNAEIADIESLQLTADGGTALATAEKIYSTETDRAKTSENKAFQYLLVIAAIVSLLTYLEPSIWDGKLGTAPKWLSLFILFMAVAYLVRTALWALKTLSIRAYHVVGAADFASIWKQGNPETRLTKTILIATLKNQEEINAKVSAVKMAAAFLARTIVTLGILLIVQISWEVLSPIVPRLFSHMKRVVCGA